MATLTMTTCVCLWVVCGRYEKPLMLQICRLLRGFTHPGTYFEASEQELALYSVERFADEMDTLLEITLRSNLVEKLSKALYKCLFEEEDEDEIDESKLDRYGQLEEYDHIAVASVHAFLQVISLASSISGLSVCLNAVTHGDVCGVCRTCTSTRRSGRRSSVDTC